ncbi:MAG: universal stress protein [Alphaproteobacteria bacterium]
MSLTSILVHVDASDRAKRNLSAAIKLAETHDAHLTGLFVKAPTALPTYASVHVPPEVFEMLEQDMEKQADDAEKLFRDAVKQAGRDDRSDWNHAAGPVADTIARIGRCSDLVVIGQEDEDIDVVTYRDAPDDIVFSAGRPVLVVPYTGIAGSMGENILVAWDHSRESARAVADAMPFLERAKSVSVVSVDPKHSEGDVPGADIARYLSEHGIDVTVNRFTDKELAVDDVLLNQVADSGADMLVMGAYGHSRLREMVLGGVTRHILDHMTVPVLMSH